MRIILKNSKFIPMVIKSHHKVHISFRKKLMGSFGGSMNLQQLRTGHILFVLLITAGLAPLYLQPKGRELSVH